MREKLINVITSVSKPMICNDAVIGAYRTPQWMAELLADALIEHGVTLPTFSVGDIVWVRDFMWGVIPCEVDELYHCRFGNAGGCTFEMNFTEADVGKYVFATEEEAKSYRMEG